MAHPATKKKPQPKRAPGKSKGGRPWVYKAEYIAQARELVARHDYTDAQIAAFFGVDPSTLWRWKMGFPEFGEAFKRGEADQIRVLEASMFQRATGYSHKSVKIFPPRVVVTKVKGKSVKVETKPVIVPFEEHYPPDVQAAFRLLEARDPGRYSPRVKHVGDPTEPVEFIIKGRLPKEGAAVG